MSAEGLSEDAAISRLQEDVHVFGKGLSRYIDTVLRDRQKQRRGAQLLHSVSAGGGSVGTATHTGDQAETASHEQDLPESASYKRPRTDVDVSGENTAPASPRGHAMPLSVVTPVRTPTALGYASDAGLKTLGGPDERAKCSAAAT